MSLGSEPLGTQPLGTSPSGVVATFKAFWAKCATVVQNLQGLS